VQRRGAAICCFQVLFVCLRRFLACVCVFARVRHRLSYGRQSEFRVKEASVRGSGHEGGRKRAGSCMARQTGAFHGPKCVDRRTKVEQDLVVRAQRGPPHGLTLSLKRIKTTSTPHTHKAPAACHSPNCGPSWRFFVNSGVLHRCVPLDRPILLSTVQDDFGRRGASEHRKHLVIGVTAKIRWGPIVFENNVTSRLNQQSYDMPVAGSFEAVRRVCVFYYCSAIGQLSRSLQPPGQPPGRGVVKRAKCKSQKLNRNRTTD
jgi:hypothetical protein